MKKPLFFMGILLPAVCYGQGVAIGDRDFTPNAAAILEVQAKNKGVLVPRMTYTERMYIQTNAQSVGLLVYQTDRDAGFYYWDGLAWKYLTPQQAAELPALAAVAVSGSYSDLVDKPAIPARLQDLQQDENYYTTVSRAEREKWNAAAVNAGVSEGGAPANLAPVATSGSYNDLVDKPAIPARLQDLQQDENYYTTVSRADREYWNGKANMGNIPARLQDLQQDENYYTTVTRAEREAWNAKSTFSGDYNDLSNRPNINFNVDGSGGDITLAQVAVSGSYNDLRDKPRLQDLQQDELYYTTVSRSEREAWNAKSNFSGDYNDLQNKPTSLTFANVATSGDYNDLSNKPRLQDLQQDENYYTTITRSEREAWNAKSNFSGSYADLTNKPTIPSHLSHLTSDVNYQTVSAEEKFNWNHKATSQDLAELEDQIPTALIQLTSETNSRLVTDSEKERWNSAASNAGTAVAKTRLSDFEDDASHRLVTDNEKTAWNAKVGGDDSRLSDERIPKGSAGGDLTGNYPSPTIKENVNLSGNAPTASGAAVSIPNLKTFIESLSNGSTIVNVQTMVNALIALEKALLPEGTVIMWVGSASSLPCGWEIFSEMNGRFPVLLY